MALRVLLADNSESIKKVVLISLQEHGVDLKVVGSGLDVIDVATKFNPEIIFVDILLQKQSGYDVSRLLKTHPVLKSIPVVLMWSGFMDLDEDKARDSLADAKLEKPFEAEALRNLVKNLVTPKASSKPVSKSTTSTPTNLSAHLEMPDDSPSGGPINIRDHLDQPDESPLPEVDLQNHAEEFQQVEIGSVPEFANQEPSIAQPMAEHSPFELALPENSSADDINIEYNEPEAVKNMDFLLNKQENPSFNVEPPPTVTAIGSEVVIKGQNGGSSLSHMQLEELVKQQCQEIIEKMAWKIVPDLASKIVKEELNRLIRDIEN